MARYSIFSKLSSVGENRLGLGHFPQLAVKALNDVGGVDQPAYLLRIVQDQATLCRMLGMQCLLQGADGQVTGDMTVRYTGRHTPVIEVYDGAVVPYISTLQVQVCEIRTPFLVRLVRMEILLEPVLEYFMWLSRLWPWFFRKE